VFACRMEGRNYERTGSHRGDYDDVGRVGFRYDAEEIRKCFDAAMKGEKG
jgi:hypothetical protein